MSEKNRKIQAMSVELSEHISAVKGTLELIDASVEEDDLHNLIVKALKRMETIQKLSGEMTAILVACIDRLDETKGT